LLYLLTGLQQPQRGKVLFDGVPLTRPRPRTGLILQDYGLMPWATVLQNAVLGLDIRAFYGPDGIHTPIDEDLSNRQQRARDWLARLGIEQISDHYPHQISGGQRQRTAIARTLALEPDLLLMDEPFGALDVPTRQDLQNLTMQLREEQDLTTIIVTHNVEEAVFMGEYILVLHEVPNRDAFVVHNPQAGAPAYREHEAFGARCRQLRGLLKDKLAEPGGTR
jgi:NitT/TauT family transport system ATP-binding protein